MTFRGFGSARNAAGRWEIHCQTERLEWRRLFSGDLAGSFEPPVPTAFLPGGKNKLTVRVNNTGDTDVTDAFRIALFASTDNALSSGDIRIFSVDKHAKLKAATGGTNVKFSFPTPANVSDGDYFILAQIDETGGIAENSEDNNIAATAATVQIRQPFIDLSGTFQATPGATVTIAAGKKPKPPKASLVLGNSGNVAALGSLAVSFFASPDTVAGNGDDVALGTATRKLGTKPNKTVTIKPKFTIPTDLRSGDYHVVATYTYTGPVPDANTGNNNAVSPGTFAVSNSTAPAGPTVSGLNVDSTVLAVGSPEQLIFDVEVTGAPAEQTITAVLNEIKSDGTSVKVADLVDNGNAASSDATAGDGIFSGSTAIQFSSAGTRQFAAVLTGIDVQPAPVTITGVTAPSEQAVQNAVNSANTRQSTLTAALNGGMGSSAALQQAAAGLVGQPDVVPGSIQMGADSLAYLNTQGILTYLQATPTNVSGQSAPLGVESAAADLDCGCGDASTAGRDPVAAAIDADTACARALVLSPASATFQSLDPSSAIVASLLNPVRPDPTVASFTVASRFGADANVEAFKGLGQNKFISISAEVVNVPVYGLGIITGQATSVLGNLSNLADLASNRLALSGSGNYVVTPKFFSHYNGDMDGAIVLANADESTKDIGLATAFLRRGAKAFVGFNGLASGPYRRDASQTFVQTITDFVVAPTIAQSVTATLDIVGQTDPLRSATQFTFFGTEEAKLEAGCDLLADNDLLVTYTWNQNVKDLDTTTVFLDQLVGYPQTSDTTYLDFNGDNTGTGGTETVIVNLKAAFDAGLFTTSTSVTAKAGWFEDAVPRGSGPALLTVSLKNRTTGDLSQVLTRTISPGTQGGQAETLVGSIGVTVTSEANPRVSITLT